MTRLPIALALATLASCAPPPTVPRAPQHGAEPRRHQQVFSVTYREAANAFEVLDNASAWWPDKCDEEYRAYWKEHFGVTEADQARFSAYAEIRKRYYDGAGGAPTSLFAPLKPHDRVAEAFYAAASFEDAFSALGSFMQPDDLRAVRDLFAANAPRLEPILAESRAFTAIAGSLQKKLDAAGGDAEAAELARFYGVSELPRFDVLYVWWPPGDGTSANARDRYLLMKYNPIKDREEAAREIELPVHELAHYLSARQPEARKAAMSKAFLSRCEGAAKLSPVRVLEEPLAVAQQKVFLSKADPERFDFYGSWYGDPWVGAYAKLIFDHVKRARAAGRTLDDDLVKSTSKACAQLQAAAKALAK